MKLRYIAFTLFILLLLNACKKDQKPDNIYQFKDYISYTTSGEVSTTEKIIVNFAKTVTNWQPNTIIPKETIKITPYLEGTLKTINNHSFAFFPDENLDPDTEYTIIVNLAKIYKNVPESLEKYTFQFKTIKPNFTINTGIIQSHSKEYQYVNGVVNSADIITLAKAKQLIKATQNNTKLSVLWNNNIQKSKRFEFKIDSVQRQIEDSKLVISWDGKAIQAKNKGENFINILGKNNFKIINISVINTSEQYVSINFSDALKKQQNFKGLITLEGNRTLKTIINGNELKVYPSTKTTGNLKLSVFEGIKNSESYKLNTPFEETITFQQKKPQLRLLQNGTILPNSKELKFNFEAINVKEIDVRIVKIFEDNVLQFLQENNLNSTNEYQIKRVGRKIAKKTISLIEDKKSNPQKWKAYSIDISEIIKTEPGAIYRVELNFNRNQILYDCENNSVENDDELSELETKLEKQNEAEREEQYWDNKLYQYKNYRYSWREKGNPCHDAYYRKNAHIVQYILASDIGVIAKKGIADRYFFATSNIISAQPEASTKITLYNYQQQEIASKKTDKNGFAVIETAKSASFAIATKNNNTTYIKLNDGNALSLSKFNVSGSRTTKGIKGFIYTERGVWRPSDTIFSTFILNDFINKLPKEIPVKTTVTDPSGKLVYKKIATTHTNRFYNFKIPTKFSYKTGNYAMMVTVGGAKFYKTLKVETIKPNRLKMKIDFEDDILSNKKPTLVNLAVNWLHGTPAKNVKVEIGAKITSSRANFKDFENYVFRDPSRKFSSEEINIFNGKVNENGFTSISKKIIAGKNAPGILNVQFLVRAFENSGDFSLDAFTKKLAPYDVFVGLQSPKGNDYGSFFTDENQKFNLVTVDKNGKIAANRNLKIEIYKINWRWWWSSGQDNLSKYTSGKFHNPYKIINKKTDSKGKSSFTVNISEKDRGRFLIRVTDQKSGHASGRTAYFYKNWWENNTSADKSSAKMLVFSSDKEKYAVGETATITFPSSENGNALVSIENGSEILETKWIETTKGTTKVTIPITKKMAPNVFVNISLLQPHSSTANDLPIRLYGVIPLLVENSNAILQPQITMPNELKPEKEFHVTVSEKNNKKMTYTLAIVEDGLLDLTRFKTPNPQKYFYKKEALGVKTWDIFDDVIGAYTGSIDQVFAIGGDGSLTKNNTKKANRFKPVVQFLGPFQLAENTSKTHKIKLPNYIGSVRTMVVAGDIKKNAFGNAEKTTLVKKPLMVLGTLPRKLSPKEKVTLPVTVFSMDKNIKSVTVKVLLTKGLQIIGSTTKQLQFSKPDEKMCYFNLKVLEQKGIEKVTIEASANNEKATHSIELDVTNPNTISTKSIAEELKGLESKEIVFNTFGEKDTNSATLELSTIPNINFTERMEYLIQYPHGCVEQTTSSVFPQLFLNDIFNLTYEKKREVQKNIEKGIERLSNFQKASGGFSYWMNENYTNDWGTSYAGHFLLEAEKKGFVLPLSFKSSFIKYQKEVSRNWQPKYGVYSNDVAQSYRLYTLALAGSPDFSAMNRLREFKNLSNTAKWRLALTYALVGQKEVSDAITANALASVNANKNYYYSYGSEYRNLAMMLETMVFTKNKNTKETTEKIAKALSSNTWMSTQTTAYCLLSIAKMVKQNGGKSLDIELSINGKQKQITSENPIIQRDLISQFGENKIFIKNNNGNIVYLKIINSGKLQIGEEAPEQRGFSVSVNYKTKNGKSINPNILKQGEDFYAEITVSNPKNENVTDIALTQIFPSGWEIVNTRFTDFGSSTENNARYIDIKDDRIHFYFDLQKSKKPQIKTFRVLLNASYLGEYYLPGTQIEAMYDNDYFVKTKGNWVEVMK